MSIREDKKFMELLGKYTFRLIDISELLDYIDEYVELKIHSEEAGISFIVGLRKLPEIQKEFNQRMENVLEKIIEKVLEKTND